MAVLARLVWVFTSSLLLATPPLLLALSLIIHFGAFDILTAACRWQGVDCQRLFRAPSIDQASRILGAEVERGVLGDGGDRGLPTPRPRR